MLGICRPLVVAFLSVLSPASYATYSAVDANEALSWQQYLVPLPRQVSIAGKVLVHPRMVAIYAPSGSDIVITEACAELRESMGISRTGGNPTSPDFTVTLQLGGAESVALESLKNSDQAYTIIPEAGDSGLKVVAIGPRGLYYGAKTLGQLIGARAEAGAVEIPILSVTDWPELTDRGLWGNDSFARTRWMGDRKMNFLEQISARGLTNCIGWSSAKTGYEGMYTEGPYYGVEPCHAVLHLEQVSPAETFTCFPNLKGVGNIDAGVWCYSQPEAVTLLSQWITGLKQLPYSKDVDVWMSENLHGKGGCKCATCSLSNRSVLEARTVVSAWKKAMQTAGPMGIRLLTSETTRSDNAKVVAELQADPQVKIWHYDSLVTYFVSELPIVDPAIATWAAAGRYAGEVPLLGPTSKCFQPWTCPQFVHYRMQESKNKKISGLMGYPSPGIPSYRFNVEAAAEWSWNPDGRSVRDFSVSWAIRNGIPDPEKFAQWADLLGLVSWDIYGSEYPRGELRGNKNSGPIATALRDGTLQDLGKLKLTIYPCPWGDIKNLTQLDADVANATRALTLAKEMNIPEFYYESLVIHGYIMALRALYELKSLVVGGSVTAENRALAANYFYIYVAGLKQALDACPKWAQSIASGPSTGDTTSLLSTDISQMTQLASDLGCPISSQFTLVPASSIPEAKRCDDGAFVSLPSSVITSTQNGTYIQETADRRAGIKIQTSLPVTAGGPVNILGKMVTVNGERTVDVLMATSGLSASAPRPVVAKTGDLGGAGFGLQAALMEYRFTRENGRWVRRLLPAVGLNNLGLLVKIAGRVTAQGSGYFYVSDGGTWDDDSGNKGIRVLSGSISQPAVGEMVVITGVSSSYFERGNTWRAIVLPDADHMQPV